jgi:hypothetical protein
VGGRYAIDEPAVIVPARIALLLEHHLRLKEFRYTMRGSDAELDAVLSAWHSVAMMWSPTSANGSAVDAPPEAPSPSTSMRRLTAADVAERVSCTTRAVRLAATEGRLRGEFVGGRWWFAERDVPVWTASRAACRRKT